MSQQEWDWMEKHTRETLTAHRKELGKDVMSLQVGLLIASVPEAEREDWVRGNMPAPIRLLYALLMKRKYDSAMRELSPTVPCPDGVKKTRYVATRAPQRAPRSSSVTRLPVLRRSRTVARVRAGGRVPTADGQRAAPDGEPVGRCRPHRTLSASISPTCSRSSSPNGGSSGTRRRRGTPASSTRSRPTPGARGSRRLRRRRRRVAPAGGAPADVRAGADPAARLHRLAPGARGGGPGSHSPSVTLLLRTSRGRDSRSLPEPPRRGRTSGRRTAGRARRRSTSCSTAARKIAGKSMIPSPTISIRPGKGPAAMSFTWNSVIRLPYRSIRRSGCRHRCRWSPSRGRAGTRHSSARCTP